jgi:hypothetical protein
VSAKEVLVLSPVLCAFSYIYPFLVLPPTNLTPLDHHWAHQSLVLLLFYSFVQPEDLA